MAENHTRPNDTHKYGFYLIIINPARAVKGF